MMFYLRTCDDIVLTLAFLFLNVAECSKVQERLDRSITADTRREAACQNDIAYGNIWIVITYFTGSDWNVYLFTIVAKRFVPIRSLVIKIQ